MNFIEQGGVLMIPILICGIIATYIIIERILFFKSIKKHDNELKNFIDNSFTRGDMGALEQFCAAPKTPIAKVVKKAVEVRNLNEQDLKDVVQAEMDNQVPELEHSLTLLGTIANISTLLGLFGTVVGNIEAFGVMGNSANLDPKLLSASIAVALLTTAAGLVVAIPSMIFNNYFNRRADKETAKMEAVITEFILKLSGRMR